jgi:hypothetical protein
LNSAICTRSHSRLLQWPAPRCGFRIDHMLFLAHVGIAQNAEPWLRGTLAESSVNHSSF